MRKSQSGIVQSTAGVQADRSKRALLATTAIGMALLFQPAAQAAGECGAAAANSVTCTSAGNPFGSGIFYQTGSNGVTGNLTVNVNSGVSVNSFVDGVFVDLLDGGKITYIQNPGANVTASANFEAIQLQTNGAIDAFVSGGVGFGSANDGNGIDLQGGTGQAVGVQTTSLGVVNGTGGAGLNVVGQVNATVIQDGQIGLIGSRPDNGIVIGQEAGPAQSADVTVGARIFASGDANPLFGQGAGVNIDSSGNVKVVTNAIIDVTSGDGIRVEASSGISNITTNEAINAGQEGLDLTSAGAVNVTVNKNITSGLSGVLVTRQTGGAGGNVVINVNGAKIDAGASGSAIGVVNTAGLNGSVTIIGNASAAIDPPAIGIATGNVIGGNATVNWAGSIDAINKGVFVDSATGAQPNGNASVKVGGPITNSTNTAGFIGIHVEDVANNVEIETGAISSTGAGSFGVQVNGSGAITALRQFGVINVNGNGIRTFSIAGNQLIDSQNSITSAAADAINVAGLGQVNVNTKSGTTLSATGTGGAAIRVLTGGGSIIDSGAALTANASGISVDTLVGGAGGLIDIQSRGTITAGTAGVGTGISVLNAAGLTGGVNVKQSAAISNPNVGINVNGTIGNVDIQSTAAINATNTGIIARDVTGNAVINATRNITVGAPAAGSNYGGIAAINVSGIVTIETAATSTITTTGGALDGIAVINTPVGGTGLVTITQGGAVNAENMGIVVSGRTGPATIDSGNDITSTGVDAINVSNVTGAVNVTTKLGKTLTAARDGIAVSNSGPTTIKSGAKINATSDGIDATGNTGALSIESFDDITATNGDGIRGGSTGTVKIQTALNKLIDAGDDGIRVTQASTVDIESGSKIEAVDDGIVTRGATGAQDIRVRDDIDATNGDGVDAEGQGSIVIRQFADAQIVAGDDGIAANSTDGNVDIWQQETIVAGDDGIDSTVVSGFTNKVLSEKTITTTNGDGIISTGGAIDVETRAKIDAGDDGIETNNADSVKIVQKAEVEADDDGLRVRNTAGAVDVKAQAAINAGDDGIRVHNTTTAGGNVVIDTNSAAKITAAEDGIEVTSTTGTTTVTTNAEIKATDRGMRFANNTGNITVTQNALIDPIVGIEAINNAGDFVYNQNADIIATQDGYLIDQTGGKVDLNIDGAIKGPNANGSGLTDGIEIDRTTGNVEIDTTAKGSILASSDGINVDRTTANVIITTNAAIGTAALPTGRGIVVTNTDTDNTITTNATINAAGKGILVGDDTANAVRTNNTTVTANQNITVTAGDGIDVNFLASDASTGNTKITTAAAATISAANGDGIKVFNSGDDATDEVEINQNGAISAQRGVFIDDTFGLVDVNANNAITATTTDAIEIQDTTGNVTVDTSNLATLLAADDGIAVFNTSGTVTVTTNAQIDAIDRGIFVGASTGNVTVTQNAAIDSAAAPEAQLGIEVNNNGGNVLVDANAAVNAVQDGVRVRATTGNAEVRVDGVFDVTSGDGVDIDGTLGNTKVTTTQTITASDAGVELTSNGNSSALDTVQVTLGAQVTALDGVRADATIAGLTVTTNAKVVATDDGVDISNTSGNVVVNQNQQIDAADRGIRVAQTAGDVTVNQIGDILRGAIPPTTVGIEVLDNVGNTLINNNGEVRTTQDGIFVGDGVDGDALGTTGTTTIVSTARIRAGDDAVDATGVGRIISNLNANGNLTTTAGDFVVDANSTGADVFVNITRSVLGDSDDNGTGGVVDVDSVTGSTVNFNAGVSESNNDALVDAKGGAATVFIGTNATAKGFVNLTANGDQMTIDGNWYAVGEFTPLNPTISDFGGGADTLDVTGRIWTARDISVDEDVRLNNLETFNSNNGEIFMVDGAEDDRLIALSSAYNGSNAAALSIDSFLGGTGSSSDELLVNSTSGVTDIYLNDQNFGPGAFNPDGIIVVRTAAGNSNASHFRTEAYSGNGAFDPATGVIDKGLFFYDLFFKPNTNEALSGEFAGNEDQHLYAGLPDGEVFQLGSIPGQMQNHFHAQVGDWLSRNVDLRDEEAPKGKNWNLWGRAYGSWQDRENVQAFDFLNKSFAFDVSYDQTNSGLMAGVGYTDQLSGGGKLRSGVFVGYTEFDADFVPLKGSLARTTTEGDGYSLGAYLTYTENSWYVDGFFKADFMNVDIDIPTLAGFPPESAGPSANNYGGALEAGYQHKLANGVDGLVFAGLTYVQSRIDDVSLGGSTIDFSSNGSLRGRLGLGVDTVLSDDKANRFSGGVSVAVVHEFMGDNEIRVYSAGPILTIADELDQTLAQVSARLEYSDLEGGLTAFLKGDYEFNDDYEDVRLSVGLRLPFEAPK